MVIPLPSTSLPLQTSTVWAQLLEFARSIAAALQREQALTPAQQEFYTLTERLGARVLDAEDLSDLRDRLYDAAQIPQLLTWEVEAIRSWEIEETPAAEEVEQIFVEALGTTRLARECARLLAARLEVVSQLLARVKEEGIPADADEKLRVQLGDFRTPPIIRSLFEETFAGEVALVALLAPAIDPRRWICPPWLQLALLEKLRQASLSHLRLLSLAPGLEIPEELLPLDERLDVAELERESQELSRYVLPGVLSVGPEHVDALYEELGASTPSPGVRALFED